MKGLRIVSFKVVKNRDLYQVLGISLSPQVLNTKPLKCGLHQNFINKNKFVKRNVVVELLKLLQLAWAIMLSNPIKKDSMNISVP